MYLHLGNDVIVRKQEIVGVFDLDNTSQSALTRRYLAAAERNGAVVNAAGAELPKSFVVCARAGQQTVYLSQLNSSTLLKRSEGTGLEA
jgi:isocitrate lyase